MRRMLWVAGALAGTMLGGMGCARQGVRQDEAMLGRLPMDEKHDLYTAEHNVDVAQANRVSAERARDDSRLFRDVAAKELDAAKARLVASKKALELGRQSGSRSTLNAAAETGDMAEKELVACKAKKDFADRNIDLRDRELDLASQQLDEAKVELSLARVQALRIGGISPREDISALMRERDDKLQEIAQTEQRISSLRDQTNQMKTAWQERRRRFDVASRDTSVPPIDAPRAPKKIRPERLSPDAIPPRDPSDETLRPENF